MLTPFIARMNPYLLSAIALALATVLRVALTPLWGSGYPFITYYPAIMLSVLAGGWRAGVAATAMSTLLSIGLFLPVHELDSQRGAALLMFLVVDACLIFLGESLRRARRHAESQAADATEREAQLRSLTQELRFNEERLRILVDGVRDYAVFMLDQHGKVSSWNDGAQRMLGYRPDEILGRDNSVFYPDEAVAAGRPARDLQVGDDRSEQDEWRVRKDGSRFMANIIVTALQNEEQSLRGFAVVMRDVTERKRAEEQLIRNQQTFVTLVERAPFGIYIIDSQFRIAHMNAGSQTGAFRNVQPVIGRDFTEAMRILWPESVAADIIAAFRHTLETGEPYYSRRFTNPRHDVDAVESYEWELHRLALPDGQYGVICYYFDSTKLRNAEAALRESEEKLRLFIEHAPAAIAMFDREMRYLAVSRRFKEDYHITGDPIGRSHYELFPEIPERWKEVHRRGLAGEVLHADADQFTRLDGTTQYVKWEVRPWHLMDGEIGGIMIAAEEVTARVNAVNALRQSEERLQLAMNVGRMGSWDWNVLTGRVEWSPGHFELLGLRPGDVEPSYQAWASHVHPDDRPAVEEILQAAMAACNEYRADFRVIWADGSIHWMAGRGRFEFAAEGRCTRMVGVMVDITDRKEVEEREREAQERLRRWNVELEEAVNEKTAELQRSQDRLCAMATELNLVEQRERRRMATELHDHLQQMLALGRLKLAQGKRLAESLPACAKVVKETDDILDGALQYTTTLVAELSPPVLRDHGLGAALQWLAESMRQHDMDVAVVVPEDDEPKLPEDQTILLYQSVRELLINSWKHARTGEATVKMRRQAEMLRIEVRDQGRGFELAAAAAAAAAAGDSVPSSKFGLFSIRERMKALGGSFTIESAPGHGTTATLMLPLAPSSELSGPAIGDQQSALHPITQHSTLSTQDSQLREERPLRVLLVDDHAMVRQGLRSLLEEHADVQVVGEAGDGLQAIESAQVLNPDVVVMDVTMPRLDGIEATRRIRQDHPAIAVVGLSVHDTAQVEVSMKAAGAAAFISKASAGQELYEAITAAVGAVKSQR